MGGAMIGKKLTASEVQIESRIFVIRGHCERVELKAPGTHRRPPCGEKIMLDEGLAALYEVEIRTLNQAVKRNLDRFPEDFMFQLTEDEASSLRSQIVILKSGRGAHRKFLPYAFTEQGVSMLSSVLRSDRAVHVNIEIMRAFVRLRQMLASNAELSRKLSALEKKYDNQFRVVFDAIRELMTPLEPKDKRPIGFAPWVKK